MKTYLYSSKFISLPLKLNVSSTRFKLCELPSFTFLNSTFIILNYHIMEDFYGN